MRRHRTRSIAALAALAFASASMAGCRILPPGPDPQAGPTTGAAPTGQSSPAPDTGGQGASTASPSGTTGASSTASQPAPQELSPTDPGAAPSAPAAPSSPLGPGGRPTAQPTGQPTAPTAPGTPSTPGATGTPGAPGSGAGQDESQARIEGWSIDFFEGFNAPLEQTRWERYGWGDPPVGHGAMGVMSQRNSFTRDGSLVIRTQYDNGQWSAGGAGSKYVHTASYGRWEVRARFPQAKGIGYAFLLWPADEGWPPEIDFAEGRVNGPQVMGVYHWDPDNKQEHRFFDNHDMSGWHTYGVIVEPTLITFTIDGEPWGTIEHPSVTDKQMFIGFQSGAMDPNGWQSSTETVDGGVPGPLTPAVADIEIDYVAHYTRD